MAKRLGTPYHYTHLLSEHIILDLVSLHCYNIHSTAKALGLGLWMLGTYLSAPRALATSGTDVGKGGLGINRHFILFQISSCVQDVQVFFNNLGKPCLQAPCFYYNHCQVGTCLGSNKGKYETTEYSDILNKCVLSILCKWYTE